MFERPSVMHRSSRSHVTQQVLSKTMRGDSSEFKIGDQEKLRVHDGAKNSGQNLRCPEQQRENV